MNLMKKIPGRPSLVGSVTLSVLLLLGALCEAQERSGKSTYKIDESLPYRDGTLLDSYQQEKCLLDVYYPIDRKDAPVVVWFHGGGLTSGDRSIPKGLRDQGVVVVAASYRLSPKAKSPAYIEDAAAAVAWAFSHAQQYNGSPEKIVVSGHSAGGYLAMMIGLDERWLKPYSLHPNRIAGIAPMSGQAITHFTIRDERGISKKQPVIDELAPLFHVRSDAPPLLLVTGDRDDELLGRYEENAYLWRMMKESGHEDVSLLELQGYDHGGMVEPGIPLLLKFVRQVCPEKREGK